MQRSLVVLVVLCLASGRALAKVPSPADSDVPCQINLVGSTSGVPDARGQFTIVARDLAHNPLAGCSLAMDFSACGPDIRVGSVKMVAGSAAQCLGGLIYAVTDANGQATLVLTGSADNLASGTTGAGCLRGSTERGSRARWSWSEAARRPRRRRPSRGGSCLPGTRS